MAGCNVGSNQNRVKKILGYPLVQWFPLLPYGFPLNET
jgi:hypothetical protein